MTRSQPSRELQRYECPVHGDTYFHRNQQSGAWYCPDCIRPVRRASPSAPLGKSLREAEEFARMYEAGDSLMAIERKTGVTATSVRDVMAFYGLYRPRGVVGRQMRDECGRGHKLVGDNLYIQPSTGKRRCRQCQLIIARQRRGHSRGITA